MNPEELNKFVEFAKRAKAQGYSAQQVDEALKRKGSSLQDVGNIMKFGADKIAQVRQNQKEWEENRPSKTGQIIRNLFTPEAIGAGLNAAATGGERYLDALTFGGYGWLNDKIGGNFEERKKVVDELAESQGLGTANEIGNLMIGIGGAIKSPIARGITGLGDKVAGAGIKAVEKVLPTTVANLVKGAGSGAISGSLLGGIASGFGSDFDADAMKSGATIGGIVGGVIPVAGAGLNFAGKQVKKLGAPLRNFLNRTPLGWFNKTADEVADDVAKATNMGKSYETTGALVRQNAERVIKQQKDIAKSLYDKADDIAGNNKVYMGKNSNLYKEIQNIAQNTTKSGKRELNSVWNEIDHTRKNAPTYETLKSLRSDLSQRSAGSSGKLTGNQYGRLKSALEKDMEAATSGQAKAALKEANAFYRNEENNPNSLTQLMRKILGSASDSELGNRAVSSATGSAWKASSLGNLLKEADKAGTGDALRKSIQSNITTRAQFNRMTPEQKVFVYGNDLGKFNKIFKSSLFDFIEDAVGKTGDIVSKTGQLLETEPVRKAGVASLSQILGSK